MEFAIAFDIDGVLRLGPGNPIPCATEAIALLGDTVPYIYLSNGSGTEDQRAASLERELGVAVSRDHCVVAGTPLPEIAADVLDKPVLVIGHLSEAVHFGFTQPVHASAAIRLADCLPLAHTADWKSLAADPVEAATLPELYDEGAARKRLEAGICAVVVLSDAPYLPTIQLSLDVLRSGGRLLAPPVGEPRFDIPLIFTNPDTVYGWRHPYPRMTQGSLRICLETLSEALLGQRPTCVRQCGKPTEATGRAATRVLGRLCAPGDAPALPKRVYMVGDTPAADMAMARAVPGWRGVLVRTGIGAHVDVDALNDDERPHYVADDVLAAVKLILELENCTV